MGRAGRRPAVLAGVRGASCAGALVGAFATACVAVDPAPNGVASARLDFAPPAIALGDTLRDTLGLVLPVRGVAYDASGRLVPTVTFQYSYLPFTPDTAAGAVVDTALVVDSVSGVVRATRTWLKSGSSAGISSGRVFARIGKEIQLADTLAIVPRPDSVVVTAPTDTVVEYDCRDPRATATQDTTGVHFRNAAGPFTVTVRGDSLGTRVGVRRWLVRWSVDSAPKRPIPTDSVPGQRRVSAIAVIAGGVDQIIGYDTASAGTTAGISSVRLRLRPAVLGPAYADTSFRVVLRADVITGRGIPVAGSPVRGVFAVRLYRRSNLGCPTS